MVIAATLLLGVVFFRLHSLPERLGHKKLQFEIVAVLGLLSLFTHVHAFWVAGLLLALIDLPDFQTPLQRIANSLETFLRRGEPSRGRIARPTRAPAARAEALVMLELALCSLVTILPDFLYRRYQQGKRIGHEITIYSVWFELRWGITACVMLTVLLITIIFYHHPSTTSAVPLFPHRSRSARNERPRERDLCQVARPGREGRANLQVG